MPSDAPTSACAHDEQSPEALLARMRESDREAAAQFMQLYGTLIRLRVRDKLGAGLRRVLDSDDVLSTVARRLDGLVLAGRLRAQTEPELWSLVQTVARNAVSESARVHRHDRELEATDGSIDPSQHPPTMGDDRDEFVGQAMRSLQDETDRRVLALWLRGKSHAHIARSIGVTPASVRMRWSRLMRTLRGLTRREAS